MDHLGTSAPMSILEDPEEIIPIPSPVIQSPPQGPGDVVASTISASSLFANLFVSSGESRTPEPLEGEFLIASVVQNS
jgi:hypothetical protein